MKGWVIIGPKGIETDGALTAWLKRRVNLPRRFPHNSEGDGDDHP